MPRNKVQFQRGLSAAKFQQLYGMEDLCHAALVKMRDGTYGACEGTGEPIGYGRAIGRAVMSIVSALAILLGYIWMIWDKDKQTWHDKVASSVVVRV